MVIATVDGTDSTADAGALSTAGLGAEPGVSLTVVGAGSGVPLTDLGASGDAPTDVGDAGVLGAAADGGAVVIAGAALVVTGAPLVGVVACGLCGAVAEVVGSADEVLDGAEADDVDMVEDVAGEELDGVSVVVDVVGDGGVLGVLVGSTAGTRAADDGGTV